MDWYVRLRPLLFCLPPEAAHRLAVYALPLLPCAFAPSAALRTRVFGLSFPSPLGLAAGFDKNAECYAGALKQGFGFAEVGTITPRPQPGNPRPRLFRLREDEAVINRLGFNNQGADAAYARLARRARDAGIVGVNIGKNKDSVDAASDYTLLLARFYACADYITVNISSPNTPGLRDLQGEESLRSLLAALQQTRTRLEQEQGRHTPLLVKLAPDLSAEGLRAAADIALQYGVDGLIIGNTTLSRPENIRSPHRDEAGGLSGRPLFSRSTQALHTVYAHTGGALPLVGVGGVASAEDAYAKIRAGASLVQLYTALVYQGPSLARRINMGLAQLLARDGFTCVADAVGKDAGYSSSSATLAQPSTVIS